jgi:hypothetical protein
MVSELLGATGCAHKVTVPPQDVPSILQRYNAGERVTIDDLHGQTVEVARKWSPEVAITRRDCGFFDFSCEREASPPLEKMRYEGGLLYFPQSMGYKPATPLRPEDIETASVALYGYDRPGWRPTWGFGGGIGGPTGALAVEGHWRPERWLGLEAGGFLFNAPVLEAYAAMRIRPVELGPIAPFFGWFISGFNVCGDTPGSENHDGIGPRLGLDLDLMRGHLVLTVEGDLAHPMNSDHTWFAHKKGRWVPWGGGLP